jgi:hypothetical protein
LCWALAIPLSPGFELAKADELPRFGSMTNSSVLRYLLRRKLARIETKK